MPTTYACPKCKKNFTLSWGNAQTAKCPTCQTVSSIAPPPVVHVYNPMAILGELFNKGYTDILEHFALYCDERTLLFIGMVCKKYKPLGYLLLQKFIPPMMAHGSTTANLKTTIANYIRTDIKTQNVIRLAVDQFPCPGNRAYNDSLLGFIITEKIRLDLLLGTRDDNTIDILRKATKTVQVFNVSGSIQKMHNKIWVIGKDGIILGSPNVSFAGLEGSNYESIIHIKSQRLAHLIGQYFTLLKGPNPEKSPQWDIIQNKLLTYNSEDHHVKLALAPIVNIQDFIIEHLGEAVKIVVRQFLISLGGKAYNIVDFLCELSDKYDAEIDIYLDEEAYQSEQTGYFVQQAVRRLMNAGVKVWLQKPVLVVNANHEAIQHDKLILAQLTSGKLVTLMGSAGFTSHVIANENAENFIYTDVPSIFDSLYDHHIATTKSGTTRRL